MRLTVLAAALLFAAPAFAQCLPPDGVPEPGPVGEAVPSQFHRVGVQGGLACAVAAEQGARMADHVKPVTFLPCLRIGAVAVADTLKAVEERLGRPDAVTEIDWRTEVRAYFIAQRTVPNPYYVVTYRDDVAVAVQLMGPPTELPARFSGLSLGDTAQDVVDKLGRPTALCPHQGKAVQTWVWNPFPIGIDVVDGRVVGFKVTWPAGK